MRSADAAVHDIHSDAPTGAVRALAPIPAQSTAASPGALLLLDMRMATIAALAPVTGPLTPLPASREEGREGLKMTAVPMQSG